MQTTNSADDVDRDIEHLYREHGARLWRALVLATGSSDVASDAVSEAFAQALRRGEALRDPLAWTWRVASRLAAAEMQRRSVVEPLPTEIPGADMKSFAHLWEALSKLSPHQRRAVVLADYAGYKHKEIAEMLGSTTGAVAVHVFRARARLRQLLEVGDE